MKTKLSVIILLFFTLNTFSQNITISGYVQDRKSGEPLIGATVYVLGTNYYTFTNNYGYFSLSVPDKKATVIASFVGYKPDTVVITNNISTQLVFRLISTTTIEKVVVQAHATIDKLTRTGILTIPADQINLLPALGGESDVIKAFQLMPGVDAGNEGSSHMLVRGGSADQNLIVLDDVPLYYVNHFGGFISVFNNDAINNATLYKGNFPARFGGRLSSVLDVSLKNGNLQKPTAKLTTGFLITKFLYEYPLIKNRSSLLLSVRTSPAGWAIMPFSYLGFGGQSYMYYTFYDLNMKFNHKINNYNRLYISLYNGDDKFNVGHLPVEDSIRSRSSMSWGNTLLAFRWNHVFSANLFSNLNVNYTYFRYGFTSKVNDLGNRSNTLLSSVSGIRDYSINYRVHWTPCKNTEFRLGINSIYHRFIPNNLHFAFVSPADSIYLDTLLGHIVIPGLENNAYMEFFKDFGKISMNIGLRLNDFYLPQTETNYFLPEPRISLRLAPFGDFSLKMGYARTSQYIYRLFVQSESEIPVDVWLPVGQNIPPAQSNQFSIGLYKTYKNIEFSLEGYYKTMKALTEVIPGAVLTDILANPETFILTGGKGLSYGLELFIQKKTGRTTGWIAYTYGRSFRQFDALNHSQPYPYHYDRPHNFKIVMMHKIKKNIFFTADWIYGSGYPYTKPVGYVPSVYDNIPNFEYKPQLIWEPINSSRMEPYHRLDFAFKFYKTKKHSQRVWTIGLYNAYNRLNPYFYYFYRDYDFHSETYRWHTYKYTLFPLMPIISYSIKW